MFQHVSTRVFHLSFVGHLWPVLCPPPEGRLSMHQWQLASQSRRFIQIPNISKPQESAGGQWIVRSRHILLSLLRFLVWPLQFGRPTWMKGLECFHVFWHLKLWVWGFAWSCLEWFGLLRVGPPEVPPDFGFGDLDMSTFTSVSWCWCAGPPARNLKQRYDRVFLGIRGRSSYVRSWWQGLCSSDIVIHGRFHAKVTKVCLILRLEMLKIGSYFIHKYEATSQKPQAFRWQDVMTESVIAM